MIIKVNHGRPNKLAVTVIPPDNPIFILNAAGGGYAASADVQYIRIRVIGNIERHVTH